jgi:predicted ferric reductase
MIAAANTEVLWYLTRGTGLVSLVLLTASLLLGILQVSRWSSPRWPRFITAGLHKNVSLLVTAFLGVHIATTVIDGYVPIRWMDVVVPFISRYQPLWLGLGAVAVDLLIAITVTSLLRPLLGYRAWRAVHWFTYACWPLALFHGVAIGTDTGIGPVLVLYLSCAAAVVAATCWRLLAATKTLTKVQLAP